LPAVYLRGAIAYSNENFEQSQHFLRRYLDANTAHVGATKLLAATLIRSGQAEEAANLLEPMVESAQADGRVLALLGSAYMQMGKFAEATNLYEQAVDTSPENAQLRTRLLIGQVAAGETSAAFENLEETLDLDPGAQNAAVLLAMNALRSRNFAQAAEAAGQIERRYPDNPVAANILGAAAWGMGDPAGARCRRRQDVRSPGQISDHTRCRTRSCWRHERPGEARHQ